MKSGSLADIGKSITVHEGRARVSIQIARTINLGNYENLKIDVGLALDAGDETGAVEEAFAYAEQTCQAEMVRLMDEFEAQTKPGKK